jgi:hypothetical protein
VRLKIFGNGRAPESRLIVFVFGHLVLVFSPPSTDSCISFTIKAAAAPIEIQTSLQMPMQEPQGCRNSDICIFGVRGRAYRICISHNPTSVIRRGQNSQTPRSRGDDEVQSRLCEISTDFDEFQVTSASFCSAFAQIPFTLDIPRWNNWPRYRRLRLSSNLEGVAQSCHLGRSE